MRAAPPLTATPHSLDLQKFSTQNAALSAEAAFKDGRKIKSITFIIDDWADQPFRIAIVRACQNVVI